MQTRAYLAEAFDLLADTRMGGMSHIRKATLVEEGKTCALKYSNSESAGDYASTSFNRELAALSNMEHQNIVQLMGVGTDGSHRFLVLEWLEETLRQKLELIGSLDWVTFYEQIGRPLLEALQYAHGRGYIHRDLKPLNVMFSSVGVPKITDFGIARGIGDIKL